jgi:hypothetical protein
LFRTVFQAGHAHKHFGSLVVALVLKQVAAGSGIAVESRLAQVVARHHPGDYLTGRRKRQAGIAGSHCNRGNQKN